ncbi:phage tail protein [Pseudomonas sp. Sample_24]|uniref:phage tail protein n=1 Tax=Pseudomonas sp. Sample_24 TaxID=2448268 RepID=UPI0010329F2A|nr:phage tail protein [Pseudomonas sp. Sample_24]
MADYYTLLTNAGIAYETACKAAGVPIKLSQISVGDGGGAVYNPAATATALKREVWRGSLNSLFQDEKNPSWLLAEVTIPPEDGGWYVREAGLWTDTGILYAIVKYPESFKPVLATSGSGKEFYIRSIFETSNAALVTLLIDDTVVKATRAWVTDYVAAQLSKLDAKQSVRVATTANIILSAAQMIDGVAVVAGDRVLVKNQTLAKDNGLYVVANGAWSRAGDSDISAEVTSALQVSVEQGTTQADTRWQLVTDGVIDLGTTSLLFQNVTFGFAPLASPVFTGSPSAPTVARFDTSLKLMNGAAVANRGHQFSGFTTFSGALAGVVGHVGGVVHCSGATLNSYSLPDSTANSIPPGATVRVQNWGVNFLALAIQGADKMQENIDGSWTTVTRSIPPDTFVDCLYIGTGLWLLTGPGVSGRTRSFGALFNDLAGYQKLPSGLIIQGGLASNVGQATNGPGPGPVQDLAFPVTFPNAVLWWSASMGFTTMSTTSSFAPGMLPLSTSVFRVQNNYTASAGMIRWIALGY